MMVSGSINPLKTEDCSIRRPEHWFDYSFVVKINLYTAFVSTCLTERLQWNIKVTTELQQSYQEEWPGGPISGIHEKIVVVWALLRKDLSLGMLCANTRTKQSISAFFALSHWASDNSRLFIVFNDNFIDRSNCDVHLAILCFENCFNLDLGCLHTRIEKKCNKFILPISKFCFNLKAPVPTLIG